MILSVRNLGFDDEVSIIGETAIKDDRPSPETSLIAKEYTRALSEEAKSLLTTLLELPLEFFKKNETPNWHKVYKFCKEKFGWGKPKLEKVKFELWFFYKMGCINR